MLNSSIVNISRLYQQKSQRTEYKNNSNPSFGMTFTSETKNIISEKLKKCSPELQKTAKTFLDNLTLLKEKDGLIIDGKYEFSPKHDESNLEMEYEDGYPLNRLIPVSKPIPAKLTSNFKITRVKDGFEYPFEISQEHNEKNCILGFLSNLATIITDANGKQHDSKYFNDFFDKLIALKNLETELAKLKVIDKTKSKDIEKSLIEQVEELETTNATKSTKEVASFMDGF